MNAVKWIIFCTLFMSTKTKLQTTSKFVEMLPPSSSNSTDSTSSKNQGEKVSLVSIEAIEDIKDGEDFEKYVRKSVFLLIYNIFHFFCIHSGFREYLQL